MTHLPDIFGYWCGLCRKVPAVHPLQREIGILADPVCDGQIGGGGGGAGSIRRGIGAALSGMRTLNRNRQLLWFALLAGLVLIGNTIAQGALGYVTWTRGSYIGETEWVLLNVIIEFATLFCLVLLLTGLILSVSSTKEGRASFFEGLTGAKKYLPVIAMWSFVLALAGMLIFSIYVYSPDWLLRNPLNPTIFGMQFGWTNLLVEYPFNPTLGNIFTDPSRYGGLSLTFWIYPSGVIQTLIFSAINLLLFVLTPFVVPLIVLERKTFGEAVVGAITLMRKNWSEAAACAVFLGVITCGVFLTYLLLQAASGIAAPDGIVTVRPDNVWITLALIYDSALLCFVMVITTVGGIAALDLYTSARQRQIAAKSTIAGVAT